MLQLAELKCRFFSYFYFLYNGNKKCKSRRKKRTRWSWTAYEKRWEAKKCEENGHVSDTLAWESRIVDRELPICRTIASLALTNPFILTWGCLLSREWVSLILPRRERTYTVLAWLQSQYTLRGRKDYPFQGIERKQVPFAQTCIKDCISLISEENRDESTRYCNIKQSEILN